MKMVIDRVYYDLLFTHYDYYCTVYYLVLKEAIINTFKDLQFDEYHYSLDDIHNHIKDNYI